MATDRKDKELEKLYKLPEYRIKDITKLLRSPATLSALILSPLVVALLGAASRGDVLLYFVIAWAKWDQFGVTSSSNSESSVNSTEEAASALNATENVVAIRSGVNQLLHHYRLENLHYVLLGAMSVSYVIFFGVGGFLHWHYYIRRKDSPETWKCQPNRFLTDALLRHEVLLGAFNLMLGTSISGIVATLIMNGLDVTSLYFNVADYGWIYFFVSTIATFLFQDAFAYYVHRALHWPILYKRFHKVHHRYYTPTAFSAVAMHPVEFVVYQLGLMIPMFVVPVHFVSFVVCVAYSYYYGMIDHSGIDLEALWPWQPPVRFHDDHHKYFHVNFGFNTLIFDQFHDTLRKKSRLYSETIFGGKGDKMKNGSQKNLKSE